MNAIPQVLLCAVLLSGTSGQAAPPPGSLADFESPGYGQWTATGTAFGSHPLQHQPQTPLPFQGFAGSGVAGSLPGKEAHTGTLVSPEFILRRPYLNFLIWGHRDLPAQVGVELLVDPAPDGSTGEVARAASATDGADPARTFHWRTFDTSPLLNRKARIRVNDRSKTGALAVDAFSESDDPKTSPTDASRLFAETFRPQFHFTARRGWLNDANGMLHHQGTWHLFHQHRPPEAEATVWGHAISQDLLHWSHRETAIPNEGPDAIFSGSGLVDTENASGLMQGGTPPFLLFYTLHPRGPGRKATQCLAFSTDGGQTFHKSPANPLLETQDFFDRDPKVLFHRPEHCWFMVLSLSRNNTGRDHATYGLFRSRDLKTWDLIQEIGPGAWYWECPDLFELPLDGALHQTKWLLSKGSGDYLVGTFDGNQFRPEGEPVRTSWGASYYGAQTFSDAPEGRRIQIAWMNSGSKAEKPNAYPGMPFNQQMSFPRELTLRSTPQGPRLFRWPVSAISQLWTKTHTIAPETLTPGRNPLAGIDHDLLDLDLVIEMSGPGELRLNLRGREIVYDAAKAKLRASNRAIDLPAPGGKLSLRILLDRTSYELFANEGEFTHSEVFFPSPANRSVALSVAGGPVRLQRLIVHELQSIWAPREP